MNNVAITSAGEQSAPLTLPPTANNLRLTGYNHRIDRLKKPLEELEVYVTDGAIHRPCNMGIHSVSETEGISCTLYLDSGSLYSKLGNTRLNWFGWPEVKCPDYETKSLSERVDWLVKELQREFFDPTDACEWCVTALRTSQDMTWVLDSDTNQQPGWNRKGRRASEDVTHETKLILNDYRKYVDMETEEWLPDPHVSFVEDFEYLDGIRADRYYRQDGVDVRVGPGFGMTAFLKVRYMLDYLFGYYGYRFDQHDIAGGFPNYEKLCVANTVADAIYAGVLKYKQLVPDVTVKEFLSAVQNLLGGVFVFDESRRSARFYYYQDLLSMTPDLDLSPYACGHAVLGSADFKQVRLRDRNATDADTGDDDGEVIEVGLTQLRYVSDGWWFVGDPGINPPTDPPISDGEWIYRWTSGFERRIAETPDPVQLLNSELKLPEDEDETGQSSEAKEDSQSGSKATVTFLCCRSYIFYGNGEVIGRNKDTGAADYSTYKFRYKSADRLFPDAEYINQTDLEILQQRYERYAAFKKDSNLPIEVQTCIPPAILYGMNLHTPKWIFGQPVMIECVETTSGAEGQATVQTMRLRTLRKYEDN